jgi:ABC-2 type transport system ATP-binding protein
VILSSHLLYEVEQVCNSVAILSRGKLIAQGRVQDLLWQRGAVRLKTTDDERARDVLAALDWVVSVGTEEGYLVAEAPSERSGELTRALAQHEVFVTEMSPLKVSLEDFFLEVTEESGAVTETVS